MYPLDDYIIAVLSLSWLGFPDFFVKEEGNRLNGRLFRHRKYLDGTYAELA
jgi:hypothetical protein